MRAMVIQEYADILKYIKDYHRFGESIGKSNSKHIKYVDCCYDMRTLTVFSVTLRGIGKEITFSTANSTDDDELLHDVIIKWLSDETK